MLGVKYRILNVMLIIALLYSVYATLLNMVTPSNYWQVYALMYATELLPLLVILAIINYVSGEGVRLWHTEKSVERRKLIKLKAKGLGAKEREPHSDSIDLTPFADRLSEGQKILEVKVAALNKSKDKSDWDKL